MFELVAIQRAATANLQARTAKVQLGQDYPRGKAPQLVSQKRRLELGEFLI
jgi:hypothetical protein